MYTVSQISFLCERDIPSLSISAAGGRSIAWDRTRLSSVRHGRIIPLTTPTSLMIW